MLLPYAKRSLQFVHRLSFLERFTHRSCLFPNCKNGRVVELRPFANCSRLITTSYKSTDWKAYNCRRKGTLNQANVPTKKRQNLSDIKLFLEQEMEEFDAVFPLIIQDMMVNDSNDVNIQDVLEWQKKVMLYNVPHGKKNRGISVLTAYKVLAKPSELTEYNLKLARILGWCIEMIQAYFLMLDDIMDGSLTRRGKPCWYKVKGIGMMAINDALLVESSVFYLLKKHFYDLPCYVDIVELFHEVIRYTTFGQSLDMFSTPSGGKPKFELFTEDRYASIVKFKTAYYSFSLPIKLALFLAGWRDERCHAQAEEILLKMGHFFQVQDDYLDCYGDPKVIGKVGTDIEDGKCSWLIVSALKRASKKQKTTLLENYGRHEAKCIKKIKDIYEALKVKSLYDQFEERSYQEITSLINEITASSNLPSEIFHDFMQMVYKRKK